MLCLRASSRCILWKYSKAFLNDSKTSNNVFSTVKSGPDLQSLDANSVIISQSRDIYRNLALEDWIYKNYDLSSKELYFLLLWSNSPCVVIGRHQNPWIECSLDFSEASGVSIARRNSGGGTVYHDLGNLNVCFLSARKKYDRKSNLSMICETLMKKYPLHLNLSKREDILVDDKYKISGTASKLGRTNAYHHCTILIDVDLVTLHQVLHRELCGVESKATSSIKSEVINLNSICPDVSIAAVIKSLGKQFQSVYKVPPTNFFTIDPNEELFPGINGIEEQLKSWSWCFGKTPKFSIVRSFPLCPSFSKWEKKSLPLELEIKLSLCHGVFENLTITPDIADSENGQDLAECLSNVPFNPFTVEKALETWVSLLQDQVLGRFLKSCILQIIYDIYR